MKIRPIWAELFHAGRRTRGSQQSLFAILQTRHKHPPPPASIGNLEEAWPWDALPTSVVEGLWHTTVSVLLTLTVARWFMLPFISSKWLWLSCISAGQMSAYHLDRMQFNFRAMHVEYLVERVAMRQVTAELFGNRLPSPTDRQSESLHYARPTALLMWLQFRPDAWPHSTHSINPLNLSGYYMYHQD
jgi:hypothetical protein